MTTKRCTGCGEHKTLAEYSHLAARSDGYNPQCKACRRHAEQARIGPPTPFGCVTCGAPIPEERATVAKNGTTPHTTCSRACLLRSVGLPATFAHTFRKGDIQP